MAKKSKVLFVCIHNAARSQMAEAYLNLLGGEWFDAESAGFEPADGINPLAIEVMKEEGIDISANEMNNVFDFFKKGKIYQFVVTVCDESSAEKCPLFPGITKRLHWSFKDPAGLTGTQEEKLAATREIRGQIKTKVLELIDVLKNAE